MTMERHAAAIAVLAPVAWGTTAVTVTGLLPAGRPLLVATMRVLPGGLLLLALGRVSSSWRPRGIEWRNVALLAICNFGLFFPFLIGALYRLPGGVAVAVGGIQPLLVLMLSWLIRNRRPRLAELAVGIAALLGVGLVVIRPGAGLDPVGVLFAVAANVSFAMGVVLTKRFPPPRNHLAATGWQLLIAAGLLLPLMVVLEGVPSHIPLSNLAGFTYLSVVATAGAFVLWFIGIRRLPAAAPPLLGLAAPVTGAVLGWIVLGQSLSPIQLLGFAITIGAIGRGATLRGQVSAESTDWCPRKHVDARVEGREHASTDRTTRWTGRRGTQGAAVDTEQSGVRGAGAL